MTGPKPDATTLDIYKELAFTPGQTVILSSFVPFTPCFVTSSASQSSDPAKIYAERVRGRKILLENPAKASRRSKEKEEKQKRRKEAKEKREKNKFILKRKEAKVKGIWRLEKEQARFELFVPLHHLWMGYMSELMGLPQSSSVSGVPTLKDAPSAVGMHPKLVKADFHGSILTVKQSKCPSLVGLSGIVIHETENTFRIVTRDNKEKLLPKQNTIFTFAIPLFSTLPSTHTPETPLPMINSQSESIPTTTVLDIPHLEFDLYGNQLRFRSAERAGRKFKPKETIEL
ncbi:RNase P/RNase MRP complex subunit [Stygiomarasmius scandens]|uniref:Ribonuclease P protein subunit n=1 Tax=Marasmiellus scandens TaxID=2682957 RepID=A0ABR1JQ03_9AGAR